MPTSGSCRPFCILKVVRIRTQKSGVASRRDTSLATHLLTYLVIHLPTNSATHLPNSLATHLPTNLATHLPVTFILNCRLLFIYSGLVIDPQITALFWYLAFILNSYQIIYRISFIFLLFIGISSEVFRSCYPVFNIYSLYLWIFIQTSYSTRFATNYFFPNLRYIVSAKGVVRWI